MLMLQNFMTTMCSTLTLMGLQCMWYTDPVYLRYTGSVYTMNLSDYLHTDINIELLDFDSCSYYELKPKQELLTELKNMIETTVKDNHWNDTKLLCMFS